MTGISTRRAELAATLGAVRERLSHAARAAGRAPEEVTLVVVTKFFPSSDLRALVELGVTDLGESREQELAAKAADLRVSGLPMPRLHFVGQLQTNKARSVAEGADLVHSVDRVKLVTALSKAAAEHGRVLDVLLQVSLGDQPQAGRGGVSPSEVSALAEAVAGQRHLRLRGVMGVPPLGGDPAPAFALLAASAREVREIVPEAREISAGMSDDLELAVAAGATLVRVGRAILGSRPTIR